MTLVDDLKATREWLSDRKHWCKRAFGKVRNENGHLRAENEYLRIAERTCLVGGYLKVTGRNSQRAFFDALDGCLPDNFARWDVVGFNDAKTTKHADVLRVLDCAIERASAEP